MGMQPRFEACVCVCVWVGVWVEAGCPIAIPNTMQAAGRMRQLGGNQRLHLVSLPDVTSSICQLNSVAAPQDVAPQHVLQWAVRNTVAAVSDGLMEWASQGWHFCITRGSPEAALIPENVGLPEMYGRRLRPSPVREVWSALSASRRGDLRGGAPRLLADITGRVEELGLDVTTQAVALDHECERELEKELELEVEQEKEIPVQVFHCFMSGKSPPSNSAPVRAAPKAVRCFFVLRCGRPCGPPYLSSNRRRLPSNRRRLPSNRRRLPSNRRRLPSDPRRRMRCGGGGRRF